MKFTYSWLKDYVALDWTPEQLAERLTMAGIEVERVEKIGGSFDGVVIAQILASEKHPNADRLSVCRVNDGAGERQIVCGATNYKVGDKVPLALPNTKLPNGLTIKESKLRGVLSQGMLCSTTELGLGADAQGLMILSADAPVGKSFGEFLGGADVVFDVEITPNRPDLLSVIGIARDVAALTGGQLRVPEVAFKESAEPVERHASVRVEAPELCPRYTARLIRGVKIGPSPDWLKTKLERVGLRPINNVVDVTNFVLLECGQPLHAFDFNLLAGRAIVVRRAVTGEGMTLIDGSKHTLTDQMLVIADAEKPVALAGIMGGKFSEINDQTTDVLLESATFFPPNIRATSKRLGVSSDSSYRFERGVDIGIADWASQRAAALIQQVAGGEICRGVIDALAKPIVRRKVKCRHAQVTRLLGVEVPAPTVERIFSGLGLRVVAADAAGCEVEVPTFRVDVEREADLIEEVCRLYGADKIPASAPLAMATSSDFDPVFDARSRVCGILTGLGFHEACNQTLISEADSQLLATDAAGQKAGGLRLQNPLTTDQAVLRSSLTVGLLGNLRVNVSRRNDDVRLFEIGRVFALENGRCVERTMVALAMTGRRAPVFWEGAERDAAVSFCDLKGALEALVAQLGAGSLELVGPTPSNTLLAQSALIQLNGKPIGVCGRISPATARQFDLRASAFVGELRLDALLAEAAVIKRFEPLPVFPAVARDVAMIVDEAVTHAQVMAVVRDFKNKLLVRTDLFDVFRGKNIPAGKKSLAYSMTYRAADRTLTDEEVNRIHEKLKQRLRESLGCEIRE
jgi:phenylalanyl-tRNA synthetase beta chain